METFSEYLATLSDPQARIYTEEVLEWVSENYPELEKRIAWSAPTFVAHGTHIVSFKATKKHLAVSVEGPTIRHFSQDFDKEGLHYGTMNVNFPWNTLMNFDLLKALIDFNIEDKKDLSSFWRK